MKRKELLWMIIPCLLLGTLYFVRYRINPPFSLRAVYDGMTEVPLTPREVAEGYDTKIALILQSKGEASPPFGTTFLSSRAESNTVELVYGSPLRAVPQAASPFYWKRVYASGPSINRDKNALHIALKLSNVPARYNPLFLKVQCYTKEFFQERDSFTFQMINSPPITVTVLIRAAGERIRPPHVSRDPEMSLKQVLLDAKSFSTPFKGYTLSKNDVRLEVMFRPHVKDERDTTSFTYLKCLSGEILDEQGNVCRTISAEDLIAVGSFGALGEIWDATLSFHLPLSSIPSNRGQLTFRGRFCADQRWPLTLSVVVRENRTNASDAANKKHPVVLMSDSPRIRVSNRQLDLAEQ
jgi:hypothetical protein